MSNPIPIIDISDFDADVASKAAAVAKAVDEACCDIGFLVITGHGVDSSLTSALHDAARRFFDLPEAIKNKYNPVGDNFYGYLPMESSSLAYSLDDADAKPDVREAFASCRPDIPTGDPYFRSDAVKALGFDIEFPSEIDGFRDVWTSGYYALSDLARRIMQIFAVALKMPANYFDPMLSYHASNLVLFNYPEQEKPPSPGQLRGGEHTDFGSLTIVHSDWAIPGGLEVLTSSGDWARVPNVPGAFVINIGDMMARWTNDRWVSTLHRVANPPGDAARTARRQSLAFFHVPNYDATVECIPTCQDADNRPKYRPITVSDHHLMKMGKMFEDEVSA